MLRTHRGSRLLVLLAVAAMVAAGCGGSSKKNTAATTDASAVTAETSTTVAGEATGYAHLAAFNPMHFYSDATIHLHDRIYGVRGGRLDTVLSVAARGRFD